jgi:hypothetical protein
MPAAAALPANNGVFALLAARPTPLAASPAEWPACFALSSTALRAASMRPTPFLDFAALLRGRGFAEREALAPLDDFAAVDFRAFVALRFVALPRVLEARVFVSAMVFPPELLSRFLPERGWYPR